MRYTARVTRYDGASWVIELPELGPDVMTVANKLSDVESAARDYIIVRQDLRPSEVDVTVVVEDQPHSPHLNDRSAKLLELRTRIKDFTASAKQHSDELISELAQDGIPNQDIAFLTGVSRQYVGQVLAKAGTHRLG